VAGKWLELLKELAPQTSRVSLLFNPRTAPQSAYYLKILEAVAPSIALKLRIVQVSNAAEIEAEIDQLAQQSNAGLVFLPDNFLGVQALREMIVARTAQRRIPTVYPTAIYTRAGGLVSYGVDLVDLQRRAAAYVDRILRGAKNQSQGRKGARSHRTGDAACERRRGDRVGMFFAALHESKWS